MIKKILKKIVKVSVKKMSYGVGTGLKFDAGPSNPEYGTGKNEMPVQRILGQYLKPGAVFYDIGANVGFFTVLGAKIAGDAGTVYAFEPVRDNLDYIRKNIALNKFKNVTVIESAISNYSGTGELIIAAFSGGSSLAEAAVPPDAVKRINVPVMTIDEFVFTENHIPPSLVKIDVEGAELEVLDGMKKTLEIHKPIIIIELDDNKKEKLAEKAERCRRLLMDFQYTINDIEDSYTNEKWFVSHYLAIPEDRGVV